MSSKDFFPLILNTIDVLRNRKARPDLEKITRKLKKSVGLNESGVLIEQMVDEGYLIRVEYKGSYSYKDASKWTKGRVAGHIMNSERLSAKLQRAISCIVDGGGRGPCAESENADATDSKSSSEPTKGATLNSIEQWFKNNKDPAYKCVLKDDAMFDVLTREVELNRLQKSTEDGTYFVGKVKIEMPELPLVKVSCVPKSRDKASSSSPKESLPKSSDDVAGKEVDEEDDADDQHQRTRSKRKVGSSDNIPHFIEVFTVYVCSTTNVY
jgi:hypothetical protein